MTMVSSIFEAYLHFQPYDPSRDSETVVINNSSVGGVKGTVSKNWQKPYFLSWDKATRIFTRDDGRGNTACFPGPHIDRMGKRYRAPLSPDPAPEGTRLQ